MSGVMDAQILIRVDTETANQLRDIAVREDRPLSRLIREMLREGTKRRQP